MKKLFTTISDALLTLVALLLLTLIVGLGLHASSQAQVKSHEATAVGDYQLLSVTITPETSTTALRVYDTTGTNFFQWGASNCAPLLSLSGTTYKGVTTNITTTNGYVLHVRNGLIVDQ
jgi:hypothetical protein